MSAPFDPYYKWLGIPAAEQPPNCYRLLGIREFEDDPDVIETAADQRMRHLRTFQSGKQAAFSQKLLNEVAQALRRLHEPEEKAEYDAQLRERLSTAGPPTSGQASSGARHTHARSASEGLTTKIATWPDGKVPATLDEFYQCLAASRVMTVEEARGFVVSLPAASRPNSPKLVATELFKSGKLTRFQAQGVLSGKIKFLSFGEYIILDKLGQGGMGQVLKAEHRRMKRTVALKVISGTALKDPAAVRRFQREVQAAARLIHPNIVTAFDANEHEGVHFFVMECVEGHDLGAMVRDQGPLPVKSAVEYVLQAARGLAYAHGKGIVHRDIKPGNLLVDGEGTVKILDMGLARIDLGTDDGQELTNTGQVMGTVDYMAPEQAEDTHSADARADIYSLGCTLYRLITGDVLYGGDTVMKKLLAHRGAPIPPLLASGQRQLAGSSDARLNTVFQKMVAKRPEDRQQTMAQVVVELEECLRGDVDSKQRGGSTEVTQDIKLSEFLSGMKAKQGKKSSTAVAEKTEKKTSSATEATQDFRAGDTSPTVQLSTPLAAAAAPAAALLDKSAAAPGKKRKKSSVWLTKNPIVALIATIVGGLALAAAGIVVFLPAGDSTIRIEINDPTIEVIASGNGYTIKGQTEEIHLQPGEHSLHVKTGELEFDTQKFMLRKGENPAVKVELLPGKVQVVQGDGKVLGDKPRPRPKLAGTAPGAPAETANGPAGGPDGSASSAPSPATGGWTTLFNGRDLEGWLQKGHAGWSAKDGVLTGESVGAVGWLMSSREFDHFELELDYRLPPGGNSGVFFRAVEDGALSGAEFHEVQLLDDTAAKFASVGPAGRTGALFGKLTPANVPATRPNEWQQLRIRAFGGRLQVNLNRVGILDGQLPMGKPDKGHIGLQLYSPGVSFRNLRVRELNADGSGKGGTVQASGASGNFQLSFDGVDDYVEIPSLKYDGSHPLTIEAYVKPREPKDEAVMQIFGPNAWMSLAGGKNSWVTLSAVRNQHLARGHNLVPVGEGVHLAAVWDEKTLTLFVNGRRSPQASSGTPAEHGGITTIGAGYAGGQSGGKLGVRMFYFAGEIDEVRVSKVARYDKDFTPPNRHAPDDQTLALYHFNEGAGDVLTDYSGNGHHGEIVGAKWVPGIATRGASPTGVETTSPFDRLTGVNLPPTDPPIDPGVPLVAVLGNTDYRLRHWAYVYAAEFSPDDKRVATAGEDGEVRIWDPTGGTLVRRMQSESVVRSLAFSRDGQRLYVGASKSIEVWEAATGRLLTSLKGIEQWSECLALSGDGKLLAVADAHRQQASVTVGVKLFDLPAGTLRAAPASLPKNVRVLAFAPSGTLLALGCLDGKVEICDLAAGNKAQSIAAHQGAVRSLTWSRDGKLLATLGQDGLVRIWLPATGRQHAEMSARFSSRGPQSLAFVSNGSQLAITSDTDGAAGVTLADVNTGNVVRTMPGSLPSTAVAGSHDGLRLISADFGKRVHLWDLKGSNEIPASFTGMSHVHSVGVSPDGKWLAAAVQPTQVVVWDVGAGRQTAALSHGPMLAMSPDEPLVVTSGYDKLIKFWNLESGQELKQFSLPDIPTVLALAPGGGLLAAGMTAGPIAVFNRQTGQLLFELPLAGGPVRKLAISDDGRLLAASQDPTRTIHIWDMMTRQKLHSLEQAFEYAGVGLAFRTGTHELLSSNFAIGAGRRWDGDTGKPLQQLPDRTSHRVAWSPDGARFATSYWTTVRIWDVAGKELAKYDLGPPNTTAMLAFAPDGRHLVVGNGNGTVYVLRIGPRPTATVSLSAAVPPPAVAPFDVAQAKTHQEAWAQHLGLPVEMTNSLGGKFRLVPPGEFTMGMAPEELAPWLAKETNPVVVKGMPTSSPPHRARITRPLYVGMHEVTNREFEAFATATNFQPGGPGYRLESDNVWRGFPDCNWKSPGWAIAPEEPVVCIGYDDAQKFCAWLSQKEGQKWRLPTEAEWEYFARAGTTTTFYSGAELKPSEALFNNAKSRPLKVGSFPPNPFGLFDVHGNVWERTADWHAANYYDKSPTDDPRGPATGTLRVDRGGGWFHGAGQAASANRGHMPPDNRVTDKGFRIVQEIVAAARRWALLTE
jgi:serine/threonine protein kinase/WD40 repeat protein/formylglycine-generating enzyme required for sulfatase activity